MSERDNDSRNTGVHRLVDMVVEEVSLVDRAANKRRYLLVKRSDDVAGTDNTETDTDTEADTDDTNTEADTSETDEDEAEDEGDEEDEEESAVDEKPSATDTGAANAAVVAALEAMSAAVETLATAQAKAVAPPKKKPPARGGRSAAEVEEEEIDEDETDEDDDDDETPPARRPRRAPKREAKGDNAVSEMKAAIKRLEGHIGGKPRQAKRAPAALDDVSKKLDAVTASLADLKKLVGGQGERIGRVEKSVGLPASRPVEGKGKKKGDSDSVSWPFDLNTSVDRDSVDKSVSFHD